MKNIIVIFFIAFSHCLFSQTKFEKESRIHFNIVPENARTIAFKIAPSKKVKWYKESSDNGNSIEAKTKYNGKRYSIEFDTDGQLQDVEIGVNWNTLPKETSYAIKKYLSDRFIKYSFKKIQIQYSGQTQDIIDFITTKKLNTTVIKYEIVLKGKSDSGKALYEFLFSENGTFEQKKEIVFRNTDNIEF